MIYMSIFMFLKHKKGHWKGTVNVIYRE